MRFRPPRVVAKPGMGRGVDDLVTDVNRALSLIVQTAAAANTGVKAERIAISYDGVSSQQDGQFAALPENSQILAFTIDNVTPWSFGSTAGLTIGSAAGGTQYMSSTDVKTTTGKINATHTAAQMNAMDDITTNLTVYCRITLTGVHAVGETRITMWYI